MTSKETFDMLADHITERTKEVRQLQNEVAAMRNFLESTHPEFVVFFEQFLSDRQRDEPESFAAPLE